jgi:NAD(P)-dependent dehydrogenase (short-subunit alcohol dehydrogenase family)
MNREPALAGQTVVVIGGSSGIGLETSRRARSEGANVVLTGRDPPRLDHAVRELGAQSSAAFDASDFERLAMSGPAAGRRVAFTAAMPALARALALELAPVRVNLIAPGFVDTPLSASLLGPQLDARREQLRTTLPIRRVVGPADIAMLAVHLMTNTAITGATYDIDGGQQLVEA